MKLAKIQFWLAGRAAWRLDGGGWHRSRSGALIWAPASEVITWMRWVWGTGHRCGDQYCYREDHQPGKGTHEQQRADADSGGLGPGQHPG